MASPMRRLERILSYAPVLLLGIALGSTLNEWAYLVETGGWYAVLGHFMAVAATLVILYICGVLALSILVLPLILLYSLNEDDFEAFAAANRTVRSPRAVLATCVGVAGRALLAVADPAWKGLWWCWWLLRGRADPGSERADV